MEDNIILGQIVRRSYDDNHKKVNYLAKVVDEKLKYITNHPKSKILRSDFKAEFGEIRFVRDGYLVHPADDIPIPTIVVSTRDSVKETLVNPKYKGIFSLKGVRWLIGNQYSSIFEGVLVTNKHIKNTKNSFELDESVISLKTYKITTSEMMSPILIDEESVIFFNGLELPSSKEIYMPFSWEVTFAKALNKIFSQRKLKDQGISSKEKRKVIQMFIKNLDEPLVIDYLAKELDISDTSELVKRFESFIKDKQDELYYKDEDSKIIIEIAQNNASLRKKVTSEIEKKWEQDNKIRIDKLKELQKKEDDIKSTIKVEEEKLDKIKEEILLKTNLSSSLDKRLQIAKENISDFRAQYLLLNGDSSAKQVNLEEKSLVGYSEGKIMNLEKKVTRVANSTELIEKISNELVVNGISDEENALMLTGLLYTSLRSEKPLLLVGPMGQEIVNILSICLYNQTADVLDCSTNYNQLLLDTLKKRNSKILIVKYFFGNDWVNKIDEILNTGKAVFFVHPFKEELMMEAKSIYYYLTPLLMDLFVEKLVKVNYEQLPYFKRSSMYKDVKVSTEFLENNLELNLHPIVKENLQSLIEVDFDVNDELLEKLELSLAYLTENKNFIDVTDEEGLLKGIWYE
ncbi:hypothetical protein [Ligilactobacillus salivarius]|uniref:hypothetical protein n=1 Tax=Ligilactobacillus salivarius TaxID=1624 RepID=UPI0029640E7C|nr:hypothetical protein [Ligilactobacillus salivarius]WOX37285.1 hypothetical protein R6M76_03660 [Ligilactobacillus salivarius]